MFGQLFEDPIDEPLPDIEAIKTRIVQFLLVIGEEAKALDPLKDKDATTTLGRHFKLMREAGLGLSSKIDSYDRRHIALLSAAAHLVRTADDRSWHKSFEIYDRLTRPFTLAGHETILDLLDRPAPPPDYERIRHLSIGREDAAALERYEASRAG